MEKSPMPKWLKIVIAIVACAIVIIGYSVLSVALGFKHGGGYLILILLFSLLGGIWRAIVGSDKDKGKGIHEENKTTRLGTTESAEPINEEDELLISSLYPDGPKEVLNNTPSRVAQIEVTSIKPDFHIVLKVLLLIFMVMGGIVMIYQAINDFTWENYTVGWVRLISSLIGLAGFILLYLKRLSGFIIIVSVLLFSVVYSAIMHDSSLEMVIIAAVLRLVAISLILLIRKDGISAWSILLHKHTNTLNDIKDTFPVKPFIYIEKMPENKTVETQEQTSIFENWLNS